MAALMVFVMLSSFLPCFITGRMAEKAIRPEARPTAFRRRTGNEKLGNQEYGRSHCRFS